MKRIVALCSIFGFVCVAGIVFLTSIGTTDDCTEFQCIEVDDYVRALWIRGSTFVADDEIHAPLIEGGTVNAMNEIHAPLIEGGTFIADDEMHASVIEGGTVNAYNDMNAGYLHSYGNAVIDGNLTVLGDLEVGGSWSGSGFCGEVESCLDLKSRGGYIEGGAATTSLSGGGELVEGTCTIELDPEFLEHVIIDKENPMRVLVTPTDGNCNGIAVVEKTEAGFTVQELNGGISNATFDWQAVARVVDDL